MFFLCVLPQKQIQRNSTADLEIKCFMQGWVHVIHFTEWCDVTCLDVLLYPFSLTFSHEGLMPIYFACCNLKFMCPLSGSDTHMPVWECQLSYSAPLDTALITFYSPCFWLTRLSAKSSSFSSVWAAHLYWVSWRNAPSISLHLFGFEELSWMYGHG